MTTIQPTQHTQHTQSPADEPDQPLPLRVDEAEREVAKWAIENRFAFSGRREFNLAICDRLAARGVPPLAGVLRRIGGKGTSSSQTQDVQSWYGALAARMNTLEANIPLGTRRQANELIEQLWVRAGQEVEERVTGPLRRELSVAQEGLSEAKRQLALRTERMESGQARESDLEEQLRRTAQSAEDERLFLMRQLEDVRRTALDWQQRHDALERQREQQQQRVEQLLEVQARASMARDQAVDARDHALARIAVLESRIADLERSPRV